MFTIKINQSKHILANRFLNSPHRDLKRLVNFAPVILTTSLIAACSATQATKEGMEFGKLSKGERMTHSEGPSYNPASGELIFSDVRGQSLRRYVGPGKPISTFFFPTGGSNGTAFDLDGFLITAEGSRGLGEPRIIKRDPNTGEIIEVLASHYKGKKLNSPNDLVVGEDGSIFFTDPRFGSQKGKELDFEGVFKINPDRSLDLIAGKGAVIKPNGIGLSPDGNTLYIADTGDQKLKALSKQNDGSFSNLKVIFDFKAKYGKKARGIDGLALDKNGNIYGAAGTPNVKGNEPGVWVISPTGEVLKIIPVPSAPTTNATFGGPDGKTLFVTAGMYVYEVRSPIQGYIPGK